MWQIQTFNNYTNPQSGASFSDGNPINAVRSGTGDYFRLMIYTLGYLDILDLGPQSGEPATNALNIFGQIYWYNNQGELTVTVNNDGTYQIGGNGNNPIMGSLKQFPIINPQDASNLDWMINNKYVPYQNIPDAPGKTTAEITALGLQYFPFSAYSFQMAMAVYDWTTPNFARFDFFRMFEYTAYSGKPLDMDTIANSIWTSNWPPFTPQNVDYMNSFMMTPCKSLQEVQSQLNTVASKLFAMNNSEFNILQAALSAMPLTSTMSKPALYSGQVDVSNLGTQHFAADFQEFPLNSQPNLPLEMPLQDAISGFMAPGNVLTLKGVMSFTDSLKDAMKYSNGIVLNITPYPDDVSWKTTKYITPLSDDSANKTEYLFEIGSSFEVQKIQVEKVNDKDTTVFHLKEMPIEILN